MASTTQITEKKASPSITQRLLDAGVPREHIQVTLLKLLRELIFRETTTPHHLFDFANEIPSVEDERMMGLLDWNYQPHDTSNNPSQSDDICSKCGSDISDNNLTVIA